MTSSNKRTNSTNPTEIGAGTKVEGRVAGEENLSVLGHVLGKIEIVGTVDVADGGIVEADVQATRVVVSGVLVGNVTATEALIIEATGRVVGELTAPTLRIAQGAQYAGRLDVGRMETKTESTPKDEVSQDLPAPVELDEKRRERDRPVTKRVLVKKRA